MAALSGQFSDVSITNDLDKQMIRPGCLHKSVKRSHSSLGWGDTA